MTDSVICPADVGMIYDDRSLLHIGYDEHGHHFEAITVKRKNAAIWDIFFPFEQ